MQTILTQIATYLITQSWHLAILAVLIAAVSFSLKSKSAHVRYLLWLILLAKCLVPPLLTIPLAVLPQEEIVEPIMQLSVEMPAVTETIDFTAIAPVEMLGETVLGPPTIVEKLAQLSIYQWLAIVWFIGAYIFILIATAKALRINSWLRRQRKPLPEQLQTEIDSLFDGLGLAASTTRVWLVDNIGQPLTIFTKLAREMGYKLVAYTGNAFFVYSPDVKTAKLKPASPTEAYRDFLQHLMDIEKEWLMLVNLGIETPYYPYLSKELFFWNLGIPFRKTTKLIIHRIYLKYKSIK